MHRADFVLKIDQDEYWDLKFTYLIVFVNLLEIFLVDELNDGNWLSPAVLYVLTKFRFLHSFAIGDHSGSVSVYRHNHDIANVFLVCPIINRRLVVG